MKLVEKKGGNMLKAIVKELQKLNEHLEFLRKQIKFDKRIHETTY